MTFEQRQILIAPVRFFDQTGTKLRPILIISNNKYNQSNLDLICCPITSEIKGKGRIIYPADYEVEKTTLNVPQSEIKSQYPLVITKSLLKPLKNGRVKIKKELAKKIVEDINEAISTN